MPVKIFLITYPKSRRGQLFPKGKKLNIKRSPMLFGQGKLEITKSLVFLFDFGATWVRLYFGKAPRQVLALAAFLKPVSVFTNRILSKLWASATGYHHGVESSPCYWPRWNPKRYLKYACP